MKIEYVAEVNKTDWGTRPVDQWAITISNKAGTWRTDYFTGLGLRKNGRPVKPTEAAVLESLMMDAQAAESNFVDWCSEFGYSDDSIRAFNMYRACLETAVMLRKYYTKDQLDAARAAMEAA